MLVSMKTKTPEWIKTSLKIPKSLWRDAHIRAMDEGIEFQQIVAAALAAYLKAPRRRQGGHNGEA